MHLNLDMNTLKMAKNAPKRTFFEKNPQKICTVLEIAVPLHRFSEILCKPNANQACLS